MTAQGIQRVGALLIVAALVCLGVYGFRVTNLPSASACQMINQMNQQLGSPATCHSSPGPALLYAAAALAVAGVLALVAASGERSS
jgi:hypothetical protein